MWSAAAGCKRPGPQGVCPVSQVSRSAGAAWTGQQGSRSRSSSGSSLLHAQHHVAQLRRHRQPDACPRLLVVLTLFARWWQDADRQSPQAACSQTSKQATSCCKMEQVHRHGYMQILIMHLQKPPDIGLCPCGCSCTAKAAESASAACQPPCMQCASRIAGRP